MRYRAIAAMLLPIWAASAHAQIFDFTNDGIFQQGQVEFHACSADGSVAMTGIAGAVANRRFRWSEAAGVTEYVAAPQHELSGFLQANGHSDNGLRYFEEQRRTVAPPGNRIAIWNHPSMVAGVLPYPPAVAGACTELSGIPIANIHFAQSDGQLVWGAIRRRDGNTDCRFDTIFSVSADGATTVFAPSGLQSDLIVRGRHPDGRLLIEATNNVVTGNTRHVIGNPQGPFTDQPWTALLDQVGFFVPHICEDAETIFFDLNVEGEPQLLRWTQAGGMVRIAQAFNRPTLASTFRDTATPDGSAAVGIYRDPTDFSQRGFYWSLATGAIDIRDHLLARGLAAPYDRIVPDSISNDGRIVFARGRMPGTEIANRNIRIEMFGETFDSDGDGLPDSWEREGGGIDVNGDDVIDLSLFELGARPDRKDLFLEIDSTRLFSIAEDTLFFLTAAFDGAPVNNPNGVTGINLLIDATETGIDAPVQFELDAESWPVGYDAIKNTHFGTPADRADPNAANIIAAKKLFVRYCLAIDRTATGEGGAAEAIYGDDMYVCLGYARSFGLDVDEMEYDDACLLMHELGHLLGLGHGGGDDINGKPNYPSIMNYALTHRSSKNQTFHRIDFSAAALPFLNEANLDETLGIPGGDFYGHFKMPVGYSKSVAGFPVRSAHLVPLNGNPIDFGSLIFPNEGIDFQYTINIRQDLNFFGANDIQITFNDEPTPGEVLNGFNDWANVRLVPPAATRFLRGERGERGTQEPRNPPHESPWLEIRNFLEQLPDCCPNDGPGWMLR